MSTEIIGFAGSEKYDLIHYLSRALCKMGRNVLVIDYSEDKMLMKSISVPSELMGKDHLVDYRGVHFMDHAYTQQEMQAYDHIFIDYGFKLAKELTARCQKMIYVSDLKKCNLDGINIAPAHPEQTYFIIRDMVTSKIDLPFILNYLDQFNPVKERTYTIRFDKQDKKSAISCMWDHIFKFTDISSDMRDTLRAVLIEIIGVSQKTTYRALKKAERGD